jgi:hypothetical protein
MLHEAVVAVGCLAVGVIVSVLGSALLVCMQRWLLTRQDLQCAESWQALHKLLREAKRSGNLSPERMAQLWSATMDYVMTAHSYASATDVIRKLESLPGQPLDALVSKSRALIKERLILDPRNRTTC